MANIKLVSVHGGHSGGYCGHASDSLEAVVERYIELEFEWVCLTEHMPSFEKHLRAPEDIASGRDVDELLYRFERYFEEGRRLKALHKDKIELLVGFETDAYSGYGEAVSKLISQHEPELIVGSVHHVHDLLFDGKSDYLQRWEVVKIRDRALRNLDKIKKLGLILDLNVRALSKGAIEPYISAPLMEYAIGEGILMSPGDDSHGVDSVAANLIEGANILKSRGGTTNWQKPAIGRHRQ